MKKKAREYMHLNYNHIWPLKEHTFGQTDYKDSINFSKDIDTLIEQVYHARTEEVKRIAGGMKKIVVLGRYPDEHKVYNQALADLIATLPLNISNNN